MVFNSQSVDDTYYLARKFAQSISKGNVIALIGNLGTGKTTFTKGLAKALGILENVGSPTFKLVSEYLGTDSVLYHIDAYRLEGSKDFLNIGGEEYLTTEDGITVIEWADIIGDILDDDVIQVKFARIQNNSEARQIEIRGIQFDF
ncbi:MAG: tRNA (adenosine(37)-N6)-threonylcarbamoyltransferase complex ATPase subunit type 1 TsaE [bacterium TMED46]|nr:MAG: tRNA (adenosine(37)-N6)-threonylcarbamoyltransferase complex ATPase subunit type 1 TsaE [bacterium TMED46]